MQRRLLACVTAWDVMCGALTCLIFAQTAACKLAIHEIFCIGHAFAMFRVTRKTLAPISLPRAQRDLRHCCEQAHMRWKGRVASGGKRGGLVDLVDMIHVGRHMDGSIYAKPCACISLHGAQRDLRHRGRLVVLHRGRRGRCTTRRNEHVAVRNRCDPQGTCLGHVAMSTKLHGRDGYRLGYRGTCLISTTCQFIQPYGPMGGVAAGEIHRQRGCQRRGVFLIVQLQVKPTNNGFISHCTLPFTTTLSLVVTRTHATKRNKQPLSIVNVLHAHRQQREKKKKTHNGGIRNTRTPP